MPISHRLKFFPKPLSICCFLFFDLWDLGNRKGSSGSDEIPGKHLWKPHSTLYFSIAWKMIRMPSPDCRWRKIRSRNNILHLHKMSRTYEDTVLPISRFPKPIVIIRNNIIVTLSIRYGKLSCGNNVGDFGEVWSQKKKNRKNDVPSRDSWDY